MPLMVTYHVTAVVDIRQTIINKTILYTEYSSVSSF